MMEEHWMRAWNDQNGQLGADFDKILNRMTVVLRRISPPKAELQIPAIHENSLASDTSRTGRPLNNEC